MTTTGPDSTGMVDLDAEEVLKKPFASYSQMREQSPLLMATLPGVEPFWIVTRCEDVKLVMGDQRFMVNVANVPGMEDAPNRMEQVLLAGGIPQEYVEYSRANLTSVDGAEHFRLRRLVSQAFSARRVNSLRPRVEEIIEDLLDRLPDQAEDGVADLLAHFAFPLSLTVIYELVGVPEEDRRRFLAAVWEWTVGNMASGDPQRGPGRATGVDYVRDLIERRRAEPEDDLVSALIRAQDEDHDRLTDDEMLWLILSLVIAGHETTAYLIANGTVALLTHPEQFAALRRQPGLMPRAVNEMMRWCGPALRAPHRYATEDVEVGGVLVRKGEGVMPILAGANYDPRVFADPERFDITREQERKETHVGFGYGLHYCLGAALARQEAEAAFGALLRRYPGLALAVAPQDLERGHGGVWKLMKLPVTL